MFRNAIHALSLSTAVAGLIATATGTIDAQTAPRGPGAVYTATNDPAGNAVLVFHRTVDGELIPSGTFSTGGLGTGTGLGNQGGLVLTADQRWLLVVNAGSDEVSVLGVGEGGLWLADVSASGGTRPISVTAHHDLVYVLNAGGAGGGMDGIAGFRLSPLGELTPIPGSTRPLSVPAANPAQIGFAPNGRTLVVTEKGTDSIDCFDIGEGGAAAPLENHPSAGATPFGFAFGHLQQLFVSEAHGGATGESTVSSYRLDRSGAPQQITAALPTSQSAACWLIVSNDGHHAYVTNTRSNSITGLEIRPSGELALLDPSGATASTGDRPIDMAFSVGCRFLYSLNAGDGSISAFRVRAGGGLTPLAPLSGLPAGANGLAAR